MAHEEEEEAASCQESSSTAPPPASTDGEASSSTPLPSDILHKQNHTDARKIIEEELIKYLEAPFGDCVGALLQCRLAIRSENSSSKIKHFQEAAKLVQGIVALFPEKLSFSLVYVAVLFELSKETGEYDKVIRECDRALLTARSIITSIHPSVQDPEMKDWDSKLSKIRNLRKRITIVKFLDVLGEERIKCRGISGNKSWIDSGLQELIKKKDNAIKILERNVRTARSVQHMVCLDLEFDESPMSSNLLERGGFTTLTKILNVFDTKKRQKMKQARRYWRDKMSDESKNSMFEVRINELSKHFDEDMEATEALMGAVGYYMVKESWKFWECCLCGGKFVDCEVGVKHFMEKHVGILPENLRSIVPAGVDHDSVHMIENGDWLPVDIDSVVRLIENQEHLDENWPLSDDVERKIILEEIRSMLRLFLTSKCLPDTLVKRMVFKAKGLLQDVITPFQFRYLGLDKMLHSLRFLGVSELNIVFEFLKVICNLCDLHTLSVDDDNKQVSDVKEEIKFTRNFQSLRLDERLLQGGLFHDASLEAVANDGSGEAAASHDDCEDSELPIRDDIITWLYLDTVETQLEYWTEIRGGKLRETEDLRVLDKDVFNLNELCEQKRDLCTLMKAFQNVDFICIEEAKRRKNSPEYEPRVYASLLREWQKELSEKDGEVVAKRTRSLLDAIRTVLEHALSLSFSDSGSGECSEDHDQMMEECLDQADHYIENTIQRQKNHLSDELTKIDARIMRNVAYLGQFLSKISRLCAFDHRSILLPLLKSFIRTQLEDLISKEAT